MFTEKRIEKNTHTQSNEMQAHAGLYNIFKRNTIFNIHCTHLMFFNDLLGRVLIKRNSNFVVIKTSSIHYRKAYNN